MHLKDGSVIDGHLADAAGKGVVGFRTDLFCEPLTIDVRAIRSISGDSSLRDDPNGHHFQLDGGTRISGELVDWNDELIVVRSQALGDVHLQRSMVRVIEPANAGEERIYVGPRSQDDWKDINDVQLWSYAGGSLSTSNSMAHAACDVGLPARFRLSLSMSWEAIPNFVLTLGCERPVARPKPGRQPQQLNAFLGAEQMSVNAMAAVRLESWEGQLAVIREMKKEGDIALLELDQNSPKLDLTIYVDQTSGWSPSIRLGVSCSTSFKCQMVHQRLVRMRRCRISAKESIWIGSMCTPGTGQLPGSTIPTENYILDRSDHTHHAHVESFNPETGMLGLFDADGNQSTLGLQDVQRIVLAKQDPSEPDMDGADGEVATNDNASLDLDDERSARLLELELDDRSRIVGYLVRSNRNALAIVADGVDGELTCRFENTIAIVGSETPFVAQERAAFGRYAGYRDRQSERLARRQSIAKRRPRPALAGIVGRYSYYHLTQREWKNPTSASTVPRQTEIQSAVDTGPADRKHPSPSPMMGSSRGSGMHSSANRGKLGYASPQRNLNLAQKNLPPYRRRQSRRNQRDSQSCFVAATRLMESLSPSASKG